MIAPDLPLEPATRKAFSSSMTRPARRLASAQAMLVPMTPPPTIRMSHVTAMTVLRHSEADSSYRRPAMAGSGREYIHRVHRLHRFEKPGGSVKCVKSV